MAYTSSRIAAHLRGVAQDVAYTAGHANVMLAAADEIDRLRGQLQDAAQQHAEQAEAMNGHSQIAQTIYDLDPDVKPWSGEPYDFHEQQGYRKRRAVTAADALTSRFNFTPKETA